MYGETLQVRCLCCRRLFLTEVGRDAYCEECREGRCERCRATQVYRKGIQPRD